MLFFFKENTHIQDTSAWVTKVADILFWYKVSHDYACCVAEMNGIVMNTQTPTIISRRSFSDLPDSMKGSQLVTTYLLESCNNKLITKL